MEKEGTVVMFKNWTLFEKAWLIISTVIILILSILWDDTLLGTISSIAGIICVVLAAKGKIGTYVVGVVQCSTYGYIAYGYGLYGESMLNLLFYLPIQFIGFYLWFKNKKSPDEAAYGEEIYAKRLTTKQWLYTGAGILVAYISYSLFLSRIGANLAGLDGLAVVLSVVAQILMIMRYAEQWILWIIVNVITIALWAIILVQQGGNDWTVFVMWCAFLVNSIYGYINWIKISKAQGAV